MTKYCTGQQMTKQDRRTEQELRWFYNNSSADIGIKSNWAACLNAACFGQTAWQDPYSPRILNSIDEHRTIEKALATMPIKLQYVLYATYAFIAFPPSKEFEQEDLEKTFKQTLGAALTIMHYDELGKLCKKGRNNTASRSEKTLLAHIKKQAEKDRAMALEVYMDARKTIKTGRKIY